MKRDEKGQFISPKAQRFRLQFDNGPAEYVTALTATEAVAKRKNPRLPHTLTNLTALDAWIEGRRTRQEEPPIHSALRARIAEREAPSAEQPHGTLTTWQERMQRRFPGRVSE